MTKPGKPGNSEKASRVLNKDETGGKQTHKTRKLFSSLFILLLCFSKNRRKMRQRPKSVNRCVRVSHFEMMNFLRKRRRSDLLTSFRNSAEDPSTTNEGRAKNRFVFMDLFIVSCKAKVLKQMRTFVALGRGRKVFFSSSCGLQ